MHSPASEYSILSSSPSMPMTPHGGQSFAKVQNGRPKLVLVLNTLTCSQPEYYENSITMLTATTSSMQTALESALESQWDGYTYMSLNSIFSAPMRKVSFRLGSHEDVGMILTPATGDHDPIDTYPTIEDTESLHPTLALSLVLGLDLDSVPRHNSDPQADSGVQLEPHLFLAQPVALPHPAQMLMFSFLSSMLPSSQTASVAWPTFSFDSSRTASSSGRSVPEKLASLQSLVRPPAWCKGTFLNPIQLKNQGDGITGKGASYLGYGRTGRNVAVPYCQGLSDWHYGRATVSPVTIGHRTTYVCSRYGSATISRGTLRRHSQKNRVFRIE